MPTPIQSNLSPSMRQEIRRREQLRMAEDLIRSSAAVKSYFLEQPNRTLCVVRFGDLAAHLARELGWYEPCVSQAIRLLYVLDRAGEISIRSIWAAGAIITINTEVCNAQRNDKPAVNEEVDHRPGRPQDLPGGAAFHP